MEDDQKSQPQRVRPARSRDTDFFWTGLTQRQLLIQRCACCQKLRHPPGPVCPDCHSFDFDVITSGGNGTVYSYTVHHYPPIPGFSTPFVVAVVDLDEGVRLVANVDAPIEQVHIGQKVVVDYEDQPDGWSVPIFTVVP